MNGLNPIYKQVHAAPSNRAKSYREIEALPLASAMGAEITNVDARDLSNAAIAEIRDALYHHKMIYFRGQQLSADDQTRFTQHFGDFGVDAYTDGMDGHPHIQQVLKEADETTSLIFGGSWHTDSPFLVQPPAISILYGKDIPPFGGDTIWANSAAAYAALGDTMKAMIAPLKVHMSGRRILAAMQRNASADHAIGSMDTAPAEQLMIDGAYHPLVRTHPDSGERALYIDESYTVGIQGLSDYEAEPLISFLIRHITQPLFTCRLRWQAGTLVLWDNRLCVHHAFNDHDGFRREMHRSIVAGEIPV